MHVQPTSQPKSTFLDATVYIVDDDAGVRDALSWLLRTRRLQSECFDSALAFESALANPSNQASHPLRMRYPSCLLLDVRMPGISGLELFARLSESGISKVMPVIFLTGHADVATAVDAVKRGAFDFCEKPFSNNQLVDRIEAALQQSQATIEAGRAAQAIANQLAELTEREQAVVKLVVQGLPNKLIADQLDISVRTVEVHRARVFEKMNVKSAVELANVLRDGRVI
jgi:two-component system, LuxR family, response regulator DctR